MKNYRGGRRQKKFQKGDIYQSRWGIEESCSENGQHFRELRQEKAHMQVRGVMSSTQKTYSSEVRQYDL